MKNIIIFGTGGFSRVTFNLIQQINQCTPDSFSVVGFLNENCEEDANDSMGTSEAIPTHASLARFDIAALKPEVVVAVGNPETRLYLKQKINRAGLQLATLVHPTSVHADDVKLGQGVICLAYSILEPGVVVHDNVLINKLVSVGHDSIIGSSSVIHSNTSVAGDCSIGQASLLGQCVSMRQGVSVGSYTMVGMGAAVVKDVGDRKMATGVPSVAVDRR